MNLRANVQSAVVYLAGTFEMECPIVSAVRGQILYGVLLE